MFSTIKEAWGEDFVDNKPIFEQPVITEHFKTEDKAAELVTASNICPCCNRSLEESSVVDMKILKKKEFINKEFIQALLVGLLLILLLHLFN